MLEEIKRYDPYTDKFIKNTTVGRIEVGTDGTLHNLLISNSYGLYAKNQEELDKCDYIDKSTKLYTQDEVIAMLTELSMKIGEIEGGYTEFDEENKRSLTMIPLESVDRLIEGKINLLKGDSDGA